MGLLRALLIYPEFPDTFWGFKHALKFIHKKAVLPPLGLLALGAMLPKEWSKRLTVCIHEYTVFPRLALSTVLTIFVIPALLLFFIQMEKRES